VGDLGIPSEIKVIAPKIPDLMLIHDIPESIRLEVPNIPDIKILGPITPIPTEIKFANIGEIPSFIELKAISLPKTIELDVKNLPKSIMVEFPERMPDIKIDASSIPDKIQVVGIPPTIELVGNIPSTIQMVMPDKPEVEMVYRGAPIDVKIHLDVDRLSGGDGPCYKITPCNPS
jgi:hypothetical protein